jgi:hypothetical protein
MDDRGYDFPVLWNDNYTGEAGVRSYPTTWVVDREGRIVFDIPVEPGNFGQELRWRVEAVLDGGGTRVPSILAP